MPKINVYLPDELAASVRDAKIPVSAICQSALERAVRDVNSARESIAAPTADGSRPGLFSRFTPRAREAVMAAERAARAFPHDYVGTEHVLLGVLDEGQNLALKVITALDVEPDDLRAELIASMGPATERLEGHIPFTALAKKALENATKEALGFGHNYIGCEHLLLGLLATEESLAGQVLRRMGFEPRATRRTVVATLTGFVAARERQEESSTTEHAALDEIVRRLDAIERRLEQ